MSPAHAHTSDAAVVTAAREILEEGGLEAVTMQAVARRVGVRAPSLYKRFSSRAALISAMASGALEELAAQLGPLGGDPDPRSGMRRVAMTYRAYAHTHPRTYQLLFTDLPPQMRAPDEAYARVATTLVDLVGQLVGPDQALETARIVTAYANGYLSMELTGGFHLGGDLDAGYRHGVEVLLAALGPGR